MIVYSKSWYGLGLLFRILGSAIPRALPFATYGALLAWCLKHFAGDYIESQWKHPFPYQAYAFIVGFLIVFRSNFGYARYWEGCTNLQMMSQRFCDSVVQVLTFDAGTLLENASEGELLEAATFRDAYAHLTSLLHAVALQTLRQDYNLHNLCEHNIVGAPAGDAHAEMETARRLGHSVILSWLDIFVLRSERVTRNEVFVAMPLPVLGGMTDSERTALGGVVMEEDAEIFPNAFDFHSFLLNNGMYAPRPQNRVHTVMAWIQQTIMERRRRGGIQVPAPLLTRMYQLLSDGMLGYEQCRKLARTPFPFPHAQIVTLVLLLFTVSLPLMICAFVSTSWLAAFLTFLTLLVYWAMNEVARELEDPFCIWSSTYNSLPFTALQWSYNEDILASSFSQRPPEAERASGLVGGLNLPVRKVSATETDRALPGLATIAKIARIGSKHKTAVASVARGGRTSSARTASTPQPSFLSDMLSQTASGVLPDVCVSRLDLQAGAGVSTGRTSNRTVDPSCTSAVDTDSRDGTSEPLLPSV